MNLQTHISAELWESIENVYESGNYSHAILEAIHFITKILRDCANVDGDGAPLVGQALGGDSPKIRLNKLSTETERNIQKGFEHILRGIYMAVRNPRSHEQNVDTKEMADAVIYFLNYIITILNASQPAFSLEGFMTKLMDPDFVESRRYAELLMAEIPENKTVETLITIFNQRRNLNINKLRSLINSLISALGEDQIATYMAIVSDEFRTISEDAGIRTALQALTPELWQRISEVARLRIENKLLKGIREGEILKTGKTTQPLATWSSNYLKAFTMRHEAASILLMKLEDADEDDRHYVVKYFIWVLPEIITTEPLIDRCVKAIDSAIRNNDFNVRSSIILYVNRLPLGWQKKIADSLIDLTDPDDPAVILSDGTPLFSAPSAEEEEKQDEDIPF